MILVDTSVWVDFLRGADTHAHRELRRLLDEEHELAITEPIIMEVLAGATGETALEKLDRLTSGLILISIEPALDYRDAAAIHRAVRRGGKTVRHLNDCLIAAIAIRRSVRLLHKDVDFEVIAEFVALDARSLREG